MTGWNLQIYFVQKYQPRKDEFLIGMLRTQTKRNCNLQMTQVEMTSK